MAKLKISENLFLEVAELNRFRYFMEDDGWKRFARSIVKSYGVVKNSSNSFFKPSKIAGNNNAIMVNGGLAFDSQLNAIYSESAENIAIPNTGVKQWLVLSHATSNEETGVVSITSDGILTGSGTKFTEVLRGQPNFPTKVRLTTDVPQNQGDFEVVKVTSDSSAILAGEFFPQSNIKYSVVGTFTPGYSPLESNRLIYEYDGHAITLVASDSRPTVTDNEFIIGVAYYDEYGILQLIDERDAVMFDSDRRVTTDSRNGIIPIVSLLQTTVINGNNYPGARSFDLELIFEHGYTVIDQTLSSTDTSNIFTIVSGKCNFLGSSNIPNDMFKGWLLVNRATMVSTVILSNTGNVLYIESVGENFMLDSGNEFVIVPNFSGIEYEVRVRDNVVQADKPFVLYNEISNPFTRSRIYITLPSFLGQDTTRVSIRYRMIDNSGKLYPYQRLAIATYVDVNGNEVTLTDSAFDIVIPLLMDSIRNYS